MRFEYLEEIENLSDEFTEPEKRKIPQNAQRESLGILWLANITYTGIKDVCCS